MAMTRRFRKKVVVFLLIRRVMLQTIAALILVTKIIEKRGGRKRLRNGEPLRYSIIDRMKSQMEHLNRLIYLNDSYCVATTRMDRNAFAHLCLLLREFGGLVDNKYVSVEEQVLMFLGILAHHTKLRIVGIYFNRSTHTVSRCVRSVLMGVLKIAPILLAKPRPIEADEISQRWKWFKSCIGALDGTYIPVQVSVSDKPRYRTRKGCISTNVLAACDRDLNYLYVLPGWEGSAADARVLRDAVSRSNGLKVPIGQYYLVDNGYANSAGFLTPFRGVMYHRKDWPTGSVPSNYQEFFNMQHAKARNVIERSFGIIKKRWAILRSNMFYPINVQIRIIMAAFLLHNYIRSVMAVDPTEIEYDREPNETNEEGPNADGQIDADDYIDDIDSTAEWSAMREELAQAMYAASRSRH